jgi:hypothetical protein
MAGLDHEAHRSHSPEKAQGLDIVDDIESLNH